MALIIKKEQIATDIVLIKLGGSFKAKAGQFYMIRTSGTSAPFLPRPISIYDNEEDGISFMFQVKGEGTRLLSQMNIGSDVVLNGPLGNGFELKDMDTIFVGGGIGTAPMHYTVKEFKRKFPNRKAMVYLGFSVNSYATDAFNRYSDEVKVNIGGLIVDDIDYDSAKCIVACGNELMLKALSSKAPKTSEVQVSTEKRMACGVGACLGCSCETKSGMKRVCKDGPVFKAEEVFYE